MKPLVNTTFTVGAGETKLVHREDALFGRTLWEGAAIGNGDFTLRLSRGLVSGEWLAPKDEDFTADVGDIFSADLLCPGAKMEIYNAGGSEISVKLTMVEHRYA